jgi:hypothetical protein
MNAFRKPYVVTRRTGDTVDPNGFKVAGATSTINIMASIQPVSSNNEVVTLPEGRKMSEMYRIYTDTRLNTLQTGNPDTIAYLGIQLEVMNEYPWRNDTINHYKYVAMRKL